MEEMLVTVLQQPPQGKVVAQDYGIVTGTSVMSRMELFDAIAKIRSLVGGQVRTYEKSTRKGLANAYEALIETAQEQNHDVNAILGVTHSSFEVQEDMIGVIFMGSAVVLEDE